jgi:uncharacterized damage-inducible protein DinB
MLKEAILAITGKDNHTRERLSNRLSYEEERSMDIRTYVQQQIAAGRRVCDAVMADTTDEQFNWAPPGTANSMRTTLVHMLSAEDAFINTIILGKALIWDTQEWGAKIGLAQPPRAGSGWDEIKNAWLASGPVLDYCKAVRAATDEYLATVTSEELDRRVSWMDREFSVGGVLVMLNSHNSSHAGDLASIKGIQGVKGLPY